MKETAMHYGATAFIFEKANELRTKCTKAEKILWEYLRKRKLNNLRFRQQHPLYRYIADFYCHQAKLVIELDGSIHELPENKQYDISRDKEMKDLHIEVLRFSNEEVYHRIDSVLEKIARVAEERMANITPDL